MRIMKSSNDFFVTEHENWTLLNYNLKADAVLLCSLHENWMFLEIDFGIDVVSLLAFMGSYAH